MTYRGHIRNGVAVLDAPVALPDATPVRVEVDRIDADFWDAKSIEELAREQGVRPIQRIEDLVIGWPEEDPIEEFLALIRGIRRSSDAAGGASR